jgi:hypothetical protein
MQPWMEPFTRLCMPKVYNLRPDPFEYATITTNTYFEWSLRYTYIMLATTAGVRRWAETFKGIPAGAAAEQLHHRRCTRGDGQPELPGARRASSS